jgi:hypothetical protein
MNLFKPSITSKLLKCLKDSLVGKHIAKNTNLTVQGVLKNCSLELPEEHISGLSWLMIWDPNLFPIKPEYIFSAQMLLKQIWFFNSEAKYGSSLYGGIAEELSKFETEELYLLKQKELETLHKNLKESRKNLKARKRQINRKQSEIERYQSKSEKIRRTNVESAKKKRPKNDLDDWITEEIQELPTIKYRELWEKLPKREDCAPFYIEEEKIYFLSQNYRPIQYQAFCNHVKSVREKISKSM